MKKLLSDPQASLGLRLASINFLLNMAFETSTVFLALYASDVGASRVQVGYIVAAYGISFFVASVVSGRQSDLRGRLVFIRVGLGLSVLAYLLQVVATSPWTLGSARVFVGVCLGTCSGTMTAYVYESRGVVGKFISVGSLGWFFGAVVAALMKDYQVLFVISAFASALGFGISLTLKEMPNHGVKVLTAPLSVLKSNGTIYLPFFIRQIGAQAVWAIFPLFLASIGASKTWIAVLDSINMLGQFVAMRFVDRINSRKTIVAGLVLSAIVFSAYGLATNYLQLVPVQVLLSIAWSFIFVGSITFLLKGNVERGTASGILYSLTFLSAGIGPLAGGLISQVWGFSALMFAASGMSLLGLALSLRSRRLSRTGNRMNGRDQ